MTDGKFVPTYYRLTVKAVHEETDEAKSFVLLPEPANASLFHYNPGQFISFRIPHPEGIITRSYSLSSAPSADPFMRICVKRVVGGRGSNWFNDYLRIGACIDASLPSGRFVLRNQKAPLLLIAGGSGITPCISLVKQALLETERKVALLYANQCATAIIYRNELDQLEAQFSNRFKCRYWLDDTSGFMKPNDIISFSRELEEAESYICGPEPLMDMAENTLAAFFGKNAWIMTERFMSPDDKPVSAVGLGSSEQPALIDHFRITLDGDDHKVPYIAGMTLLQAALAAGVDVPVSCTEGHCGTCMSQLRCGEVDMVSTKALSKSNLRRGYVLACQSRPSTSEPIWLDFDL